MNVPLLLLLLLLNGRSSTNERLLLLLRIHHVRMDRLKTALRSVHLHRLLLLLLNLLVLDNIRSVRMLEMLLLLLLLLLRMLHLTLMQVNVLLLLLLVKVMLLVLLLHRLLLHVMRMNSSRWRKGNGRTASQDVGFEFFEIRVREKWFLRCRPDRRRIDSSTKRHPSAQWRLLLLLLLLLVLHVLPLQFSFLLFQQIFQQKGLFLLRRQQ